MLSLDAGPIASPAKLPLAVTDASIADPQPLAVNDRGWTWWVGTVISLGILAAVVLQLRTVDFAHVRALLPTSPLFWLVFIASYFSSPAADWLIYHRLWNIPARGFTALLRKLIGNELLFGYVGELYLYTWARRHTAMISAPFGAIKDVAILSAMTANAVTLILLVIAWPLLATLHLGLDGTALFVSVGIIVAISSAVLLFRKKLFGLPPADLRYVALIHLVRIGLTTGLAALCWHLALPGVALNWWLMLATLRMLVSRLPLLPNKDIVFAGLAVFLIGHDADISALMAMMASIVLAMHVAVGSVLVAADARRFVR